MDKLNILVTGGGAPGIEGTLYSLRNHNVVTCDMNKNAVGKYLSDKFYQIYPASNKSYLKDLKWICKEENIDVVLPQNTAELDKLYNADLPVKVAIAGRNIGKNDVCEGEVVRSLGELANYFLSHNKFVLKPLNSSGGRGVRIISHENEDFMRKPGIPVVTMDQLLDELPKEFELWVMPYYEGEETTVDCFVGNEFTAIPRKRVQIRSGITFEAEVVKNEDLIEKCRVLAERLGLKYAFGFQFIDGKVIECNARVQGSMVVSTFAGANMIEAACLHAMGLPYSFDIDWDTKFIRYWGGIGINNEIIKI